MPILINEVEYLGLAKASSTSGKRAMSSGCLSPAGREVNDELLYRSRSTGMAW